MEAEDKYVALAREIVLANIDRSRFRVFLFGSRARQTARRSSDIDIGIWGPEPVDPRVLAAIREQLEESLVPYPSDIVDFAVAPEALRSQALRSIVEWNPAFA